MLVMFIVYLTELQNSKYFFKFLQNYFIFCYTMVSATKPLTKLWTMNTDDKEKKINKIYAVLTLPNDNCFDNTLNYTSPCRLYSTQFQGYVEASPILPEPHQ